VTTENDQLRAARERISSSTCPDERLSRKELADLVNAYIWHRHKRMVELDASYFGKLERGVIRWPNELYREALRAVLEVSTDAELGFSNSRRPVVKVVGVNRRQAVCTAGLGLGGLALGALAPVAALLEGDEPTAVPARVGATDIEYVRDAARVFKSWDFTYGGGLVWEAVRVQLRWSAGMLESTCPEPLRPELFSAVGYLADVTGYMAIDACAHEEARRVLCFALGCAEKADDWHLRAHVLGNMAFQASQTGRPDEGLTLAEHALVRADRLTPTERAIVHTHRARALAKMARVPETLAAIGTADDHFAHATPANDPPLVAYYGATLYAGVTGRALADLAMNGGDPIPANDRLTTAVADLTPGYARSRVITQIKLASLAMSTGDPVEAATLGTAALESAGTIRSRRVTDDLRELARHATQYSGIDEVDELHHRITTAVLAA
jgi:hypothetical protein